MTEQEIIENITVNTDKVLLLIKEGNEGVEYVDDNETIVGVGADYQLTKTAGGLSLYVPKSIELTKQDEAAYFVCRGKVLAVGRDCFKDKRYFPEGDRCKVGDWILFKAGQAETHKLLDGTIIAFLLDSFAGNIISEDLIDKFRA